MKAHCSQKRKDCDSVGELKVICILKSSLFHILLQMLLKSSHLDRGPCYLLFPISYLYMDSTVLLDNKKLLWLLFSSANQTTDHCSSIYSTRPFLCEVSISFTNATHCQHCVSYNLLNFNHCCFTLLNEVCSNYVWVLNE